MSPQSVALRRGSSEARRGARPTLDPRVSAERIAKRLGLGASTVRARLKAWRATAFLALALSVAHLARGSSASSGPASSGARIEYVTRESARGCRRFGSGARASAGGPRLRQ